jgi:hypothetical protein
LIRERFLTPRVRVKSSDELNAWLLDRCVAYAKAHKHPEFKDQTSWQAFEAERASLIAVPGRFDGFHAVMASVSKTCPVSFDRNAMRPCRPRELREVRTERGQHGRSWNSAKRIAVL